MYHRLDIVASAILSLIMRSLSILRMRVEAYLPARGNLTFSYLPRTFGSRVLHSMHFWLSARAQPRYGYSLGEICLSRGSCGGSPFRSHSARETGSDRSALTSAHFRLGVEKLGKSFQQVRCELSGGKCLLRRRDRRHTAGDHVLIVIATSRQAGGIRPVQGIILDIGVEIDLVLIANRIDLQETRVRGAAPAASCDQHDCRRDQPRSLRHAKLHAFMRVEYRD
jgi:hypothetical protein